MMENKRGLLFQNVANMVTVFGLILSVWLIFVVIISSSNIWLIAALSALIGLSDFIDGKVARYLNIKTRFGAALDRLRDKIFICTILAALLYNLYERPNTSPFALSLTSALVVVAIFLEFCIFGRWLYDLIKGFDISSGQNGRIKMFIQSIVVMAWLVSLITEKYYNYQLLDVLIYPLNFAFLTADYFAAKGLIVYFQKNQTAKKNAPVR